jgi:hypothetical protein
MTKSFDAFRLKGHPMRTPLPLVLHATSPLTTLRTAQFQVLTPRPPELRWFIKLINVNIR